LTVTIHSPTLGVDATGFINGCSTQFYHQNR
jgi:hypothetical protein